MNAVPFTRALPLLSLALLAACGTATQEQTLAQRYDAARDKNGAYTAPTEAEFAEAERLFTLAFAGNAGDDFVNGMASLGFAVSVKSEGSQDILIVEEAPDRRRGGGFYLIRLASLSQTDAALLTAPHTFHDEHTGPLSLSMFLATDAAGAGFNTVFRHAADNADLAHAPVSFFQAFILAFAATHPAGYVDQFHGYDPNERTTDAARNAVFIVSAGVAKPSAAFRAVRDRLRTAYGSSVIFYPDDTKELGATDNVNGQALRNRGFGGFIHVEMSPAMRNRLAGTGGDVHSFYRNLRP